MKPDRLWAISVFEVTPHGIPNRVAKLGKIIGFSEDRSAHSTGCVPAFRRFFDDEKDLDHGYFGRQSASKVETPIFSI